MDVGLFDYPFPRARIAQAPLPERDAARMLLLDRASGAMGHRYVRDLPQVLEPGDVLVINTSRVVPARLVGRRESGGRIELLVLREGQGAVAPGAGDLDPVVSCLATRTNRLRPGDRLFFAEGITARVCGREDDRIVVEFPADGDLPSVLERIGSPPLPPYIERPAGADARDRERYQTVYADTPGSVAAPTAGLHFTPRLLDALRARDIRIAPLCLHVGADTFAPVRTALIAAHTMHGETYEIPAATVAQVTAAKAEGRRVIAVGTTCVRALESACRSVEVPECRRNIKHRTSNIGTLRGVTHLFITPGYSFHIVDALLTNFHQPRTTLLMLVAAFAGLETIRAAYAEAIAQEYRLFSYGDCMLIA